MLILSLDFETSGLDKNSDRITEVGAVRWSTTLGQMISADAYLVDNEIPITKEITELTGIRKGMIDKFGLNSKTALTRLLDLIDSCEAIVGQNIIEFDIPFLQTWCQREGETFPERLIIDTKTDLPGVQSKHLGYMAADAQFVNPFPHRALADCLTVLKLVGLHDGRHYPTTFEDVCARARSPRVTVAAQISREQNQLAKKRGYWWSPDRRVWYKTIKEMDLETEAKEAPFDISRIEPILFH